MIRPACFYLASSVGALACGDGLPLVSSEADAPEAYIALGEVPLAQPFSLQVMVCDATAVGSMEIDAVMPAHQHGMNYTPDVTEMGGGVFSVDGMLFHMPGEWEVRVEIELDQTSVPYTHTIRLK